MFSLIGFFRARREHYAAWCNAISGGAFVGGVMFNTIGMRQDLSLALVGLGVVLFFLFLGSIFKGGK